MPSAFVIPGAGERSEKEFRKRVETFARNLGEENPGEDWKLQPIWWSDRGQYVGRIREGLPSTYPPRPSRPWELGDGPTIGEAEADFRVPGWANLLWHGRRYLLEAYAGEIADVLHYWSDREAIQRRVAKSISEVQDGAPLVNVIAHSLGGLIAVDLAAAAKVRINVLVTFGTPVSAAYVLDPTRMGLQPYQPEKPVLIGNIARWTNLWNKYDPVALHISKVFVLQDGYLVDRKVELPDDMDVSRAHLAYWDLAAVRVEVRTAFSGPPVKPEPNAT